MTSEQRHQLAVVPEISRCKGVTLGCRTFIQDMGAIDNCGLNDLLDDLKEIPSLKDWVAAPTHMIEVLDINANSVQAFDFHYSGPRVLHGPT